MSKRHLTVEYDRTGTYLIGKIDGVEKFSAVEADESPEDVRIFAAYVGLCADILEQRKAVLDDLEKRSYEKWL